MSDKTYDWAAEKSQAQDNQPIDPAPQQVPIDPAAERQAFAELLALIGAPDSGDADTKVVALDVDAFAEETFSPTDSDNPSPRA
ncbi:MAG: hypothetical protein AB7E81_16555 [Hyphomicrobiaceae bacterium]|jgi:hypothetical protein